MLVNNSVEERKNSIIRTCALVETAITIKALFNKMMPGTVINTYLTIWEQQKKVHDDLQRYKENFVSLLRLKVAMQILLLE
jgi:hypothetical protein